MIGARYESKKSHTKLHVLVPLSPNGAVGVSAREFTRFMRAQASDTVPARRADDLLRRLRPYERAGVRRCCGRVLIGGGVARTAMRLRAHF
jgi:hypothetical protein